MRLKQKHVPSGFLAILMWVLTMVGFTSCEDTETVDTSGFKLFYTSMTDIAPGMENKVIAQPSYKGLAPSDFSIYNITFGEENTPYTDESECFRIDSSVGSIELRNTANLAVGVYKISIRCVSGGTTYSFPDIVEVNFLKPVPDGIIVEPNPLTADYNDILDANSDVELPTAQVTTEESASHITIKGYAISNVRRGDVIYDNEKNPLFAISSTGEISIVRGHNEAEEPDFVPGVYTLDLKLSTDAADSNSELGLFMDAVNINVISAPRGLTYEDGYIETGIVGNPDRPARGFTSAAPVLRGSTEGTNYTITAVKKNGVKDDAAFAKFAIDASTGIVTVGADHGFTLGDVYTLDISVTNAYSAEGEVLEVEDALKVTVVDWISAPESLIYAPTTGMRSVAFEVIPEYEGGTTALTYSFVNLPESLSGYLQIDPATGRIYAEEGHDIAPNTYSVTVKATNLSGELESTLSLTIDENPCYFTYIHYGTNLNGDATACENQYRFHSLAELQGVGQLTPETDLNMDAGITVKWSARQVVHSAGIEIDANTGVLKLGTTEANWKDRQLPVVFVTATATLGELSYSRTVPVFFHFSKAFTDGKYGIENVVVEYTPIAFRVSPRLGGRSSVPVITGISDYTNFYMDYRRTFNYYNLNGVDSEGNAFVDGATNAAGGSFMQEMWIKCNNGSNLSQKTPVSYFQSNGRTPKTDLLTNTLLYVDNTAGSSNRYSIVVNPNMWQLNGGWADGVFHGQITITNIGISEAGNLNNAVQTFPIAIWFDKSLN